MRLTHTGHGTSHWVMGFLLLLSQPSCFSQPKVRCSCLETCALFTVGLLLLSVARSLEELADTLQLTILIAHFRPTIFKSALLCSARGLAEGFSNDLQSMGASWSSLRCQNSQRYSECQHTDNPWASFRSGWKCTHEKCRANPC